ncbi:hypothetical protein H4R19_001310, partial [Coemansia spiralis]
RDPVDDLRAAKARGAVAHHRVGSGIASKLVRVLWRCGLGKAAGVHHHIPARGAAHAAAPAPRRARRGQVPRPGPLRPNHLCRRGHARLLRRPDTAPPAHRPQCIHHVSGLRAGRLPLWHHPPSPI